MKLRNKKTGEIYDFKITPDYDDVTSGWKIENKDFGVRYYSHLAELNEEWEDYEDELYYIISAEHKGGYICALKENYKELCETAKELGIGFETEKEAREAVEKLKAWKRLKDKGFRIHEWYHPDDCEPFIVLETNIVYDDIDNMELQKDLDLLFGGEECL